MREKRTILEDNYTVEYLDPVRNYEGSSRDEDAGVLPGLPGDAGVHGFSAR